METEVFDVESDSPPVAQVGLDFNLDTKELSSTSLQNDGILLSDFIRIPQMNEGHVLEDILPEGVSVGFGLGDNFVGIPAEQIFEVFTNNNPESIITGFLIQI